MKSWNSQLISRKDEIMELATNSFYSILADAPGGTSRFDEMMYHYAQVPPEYYDLIIDPRELTNVPEFLETYNTCDLEKVVTWVHIAFERETDKIAGLIMTLCDLERVVTWVHIAFERETDKIAGLIMTLPNLYQLWVGESLTH